MYRSSVDGKTVSWIAGTLLGSLTVGAFVGLVGSVVPSRWLVSGTGLLAVVAAMTVLAFLGDVAQVPNYLPQAQRQVPQDVASAGAPGAFIFGFEMGTGMRTWTSSFLPYVALALALWIGLPWSLLLGASFGFGRVLGLVPIFRSANPVARMAVAGGLIAVTLVAL